MNRNYLRGRQKEYSLRERLEKEGYIVLRTRGSHGFADLVAIKPRTDGDADLFPEVRLIQVKSSVKFAKERLVQKTMNHLLVDWYFFPIKVKGWYEKHSKSSKSRLDRHQPKRR